MDFDIILDHLGHFGKFQCCVMLLAGIAQIFGGMQSHSSSFIVFGNTNLKSARYVYVFLIVFIWEKLASHFFYVERIYLYLNSYGYLIIGVIYYPFFFI